MGDEGEVHRLQAATPIISLLWKLFIHLAYAGLGRRLQALALGL
jgi:hypothetical protein